MFLNYNQKLLIIFIIFKYFFRSIINIASKLPSLIDQLKRLIKRTRNKTVQHRLIWPH
jgi:hypothetical protein